MMEHSMESFSLENYLSNGVEKIIKGIAKASLRNPGASVFMTKHILDSRKAKDLRNKAAKEGNHIPPFLIASITNKCNLHCAGCYARANNSCTDNSSSENLMTQDEWGSVFHQSEELGIEFILLAGGEPFVREDVLKEASQYSKVLFPVFTNGTMIDYTYLDFLTKNRNILPVLSIEGGEEITDKRRGAGIYKQLINTMDLMNERGILFGASVTVTKSNLEDVMSDSFVEELSSHGVKAIVYVEYVPVDLLTIDEAPDDKDRARIDERLKIMREGGLDTVLISFPGDEKTSGGCLAAGRGFFHINPHGGAEPCPFSPYSDTNIRKLSLKDALESPLFTKLRNNGNLTEHHVGGCTLFEQREEIEKLLV